MSTLLQRAIITADEIRTEMGLNIYQPVNVIDACVQKEITVRIVPIDMEGMYFSQGEGDYSEIWLSNERPLARRNFTCAHEFGHHIFGHGSKVDGLASETEFNPPDNFEEYLVDCFAGALLMPLAGIHAEFSKRGWVIAKATPVQFYTVASVFGTGYQTLVAHCKANRIISETKAAQLLKLTPAKILRGLIGNANPVSYFKIIDHRTNITPVDMEEGNYLLFPRPVEVEGDQIALLAQFDSFAAYKVMKAGIVRIFDSETSSAYFVRIQRAGYIGLAEYRHFETETDEI